jgi:hypothetical protein
MKLSRQYEWVKPDEKGWWPWPPNCWSWGEIGRVYRASGAPWVPDATDVSHPNSSWKMVDGTIYKKESTTGEVYRFDGRKRSGNPYTGPMAGIACFEPQWTRVSDAKVVASVNSSPPQG